MIDAPVSIGELVDKITILQIKKEKIHDPQKTETVKKELNLLVNKYKAICTKILDDHMKGLREVNEKLWEIEDAIRKKERAKEFDQEFIELARSVYKTNDIRSQIKMKINVASNSYIMEVKSYEKYE